MGQELTLKDFEQADPLFGTEINWEDDGAINL